MATTYTQWTTLYNFLMYMPKYPLIAMVHLKLHSINQMSLIAK